MKEVVIISGVRTPIGGYGKAFKDVSAIDLGAHVIDDAIRRANIEKEEVDQVIMGCSVEVTNEVNIARSCAVQAGLPVNISAFTVNQVCASGLRSIITAILTIKAGEADIIVAGGTENMSRMPYVIRNARWGMDLEDGIIEDALFEGPLSCPFNRYQIGVTAENIRKKYKISRMEQDLFALESHRKACAAIEAGKFSEEISPMPVDDTLVSRNKMMNVDQNPRCDLTLARMSKYQPTYSKDGTITVGTTSGFNDSAAAVVVMSLDRAKELGIKPKMRMVSQASIGVNPALSGLGPIPSVKRALATAELDLKDIGLIELNEHFSASALAVGKELGLDWNKVNVNGGSLAIGNPIGATAAILTIRLMYEMSRRHTRYGMVTSSIGGGQGIAAIFENLTSN